MPNVDPDQGLIYPADPDSADNPSGFSSFIGTLLSRLNKRYTNLADRTARDLAPVENQLTALAAEDRVDIYSGSTYLSLFNRAFFSTLRVSSFNVPASSVALTAVTGAVVNLPATGQYGWTAEIFASGVTASDVKFAYTWPAGASAIWGIQGGDPTTLTNYVNSMQTTSGNSISVGLAGTSAPTLFTIHGEINPSGNAGALQLQAAQVASDPTGPLLRVVRQRLWQFA